MNTNHTFDTEFSNFICQLSTLSLEENYFGLYKYLVNHLKKLTGAHVALWTLSQKEGSHDTRYLQIKEATEVFDPEYLVSAKLPIDIPESSLTALAMAKRQFIFNYNLNNGKYLDLFHNKEFATSKNLKSFLVALLMDKDRKVLGSINLYSEEENKFDENLCSKLETVSNIISNALVNKSKYTYINQLADLSSKLAHYPKLNKHELSEQITKLCKANCCAILPMEKTSQYLGDGDIYGFKQAQNPKEIQQYLTPRS